RRGVIPVSGGAVKKVCASNEACNHLQPLAWPPAAKCLWAISHRNESRQAVPPYTGGGDVDDLVFPQHVLNGMRRDSLTRMTPIPLWGTLTRSLNRSGAGQSMLANWTTVAMSSS